MAKTIDDLWSRLQAIYDALKSGVPDNADSIIVDSITCDNANQGYPIPSITVPNGFSLVIKAHPSNALLAFIYVSDTKSTTPVHLYPLVPNEPIAYRIKNGSALWVSTNIAGSIAIITVEKRK